MWSPAVQGNPTLFDGPVVACARLRWIGPHALRLSWARATYRHYALRRVPGATALPSLFVDSSERLGRRRWVIERTMSWLTGYRRLNQRYERKPGNYLALLGLAAALCCYKRLLNLTM